MQRAIEIFAVINLGVTGLSHVLAPRSPMAFFIRLREAGEPGVFVIGAMSLCFGSIIAAFYDVWSGLGLLLTLLGWAHVIKACVYLTAPAFGMRALERLDPENPHGFFIAGVGLLLLAALLVWVWL